MVISQPSGSDQFTETFERLHPDICRWIYQKGWTELREVQARAIDVILGTKSDAIIAAATAAGKTEAAFLPILTEICDDHASGFRVLYIGPLRALINDQFFRLEELCEALKVPVAKWHGDVANTMRRRAREKPEGVLLITPESLEALFVLRPEYIKRMFDRLSFILIDELHVFLSSDRGVHLASLLKRLEYRLQNRPRRIGLSATIGDLNLAASWLRPDDPSSVELVNVASGQGELKLQIRGITAPLVRVGTTGQIAGASEDAALRQVADHLLDVMRAKGNHLIFTKRRREVETLSDMLRTACESSGFPNEFFPHHGNLSRDARETLEARLKEGTLPTTAVTTATLELGIDIGSVETVAQLGAPRSTSALRQRLGRSGRRTGKPAVLRVYTVEQELEARSSLLDRLRLETVQSIATVQLLLARWIEPPSPLTLHLSTMLHQVMASIVEYGGATASRLFQVLGGPGPFAAVDASIFEKLLRDMASAAPPLLEQASDGTLMLGPLGEAITDKYDFYAVFKTPEEFKIMADGRTLGTVSINNSFGPDDYIIFSGLRWRVLDVDDRGRIVRVEAAPAGRVPKFEGTEPGPIHDRVVAAMKEVFIGTDIPIYLDKPAAAHLAEGRRSFRDAGLANRQVALDDDQLILFPWCGTPALNALRFALRRGGVKVTPMSIALGVPRNEIDQLLFVLRSLVDGPNVDASELADFDENLERAKYDQYISRDLLRQAAAADRLDVSSMSAYCRGLMEGVGAILAQSESEPGKTAQPGFVR